MKKVVKFKPRWYKPFQLIKRNNELESTVSVLLDIIDEYSDDLERLEQIVKSVEEDNKSILNAIEVKPKRIRKTKKKEGK